MMWAVMGIGMLIQTIQGASQVNQQRQALLKQAAVSQQQLQNLRKGHESGLNIKKGSIMGGPSTSIYVEYPQKAHDNLQRMQTGNYSERMGLESQMRKDFGQMKESFFKENHYETNFGAQGKGEVLTDEKGRPKPKQGAESPQHRTARQSFESQQRSQLGAKHGQQTEQFMKSESSKVRSFLGEHAALLGDPVVQGELQKMVVSGKKRALKLQQDQDDERWKIDMPPTTEIQEAVQLGLNDLRQMEQRHVEAEEKSPDHQALIDYQHEFAQVAAREKDKIQDQKQSENFLMDPRKMMAMASAPPKPPRFDEVLPGYLTEQIFQLGIYEA